MTTTKTLIPEVTISTDHEADVLEALQVANDLAPQIQRLGGLVERIRSVNDEAMLAIAAAGIPIDTDAAHELIGYATAGTRCGTQSEGCSARSTSTAPT